MKPRPVESRWSANPEVRPGESVHSAREIADLQKQGLCQLVVCFRTWARQALRRRRDPRRTEFLNSVHRIRIRDFGYHASMLRMSRERFEDAVRTVLDRLPEDLARAIENVAVTVEEEPTRDDLIAVGLDPESDSLFGLYQGIALPEREVSHYSALPDRIVIYRLPLLEACTSRLELLREIENTVIHELGHYFGLPEEELP